jgi:predicted nucleic acid binding AN1-type Zn finger protein
MFERHISSSECDPANYARVMKKKKCPVQGCREKLTTINTYTCKSCKQAVCLKHRLENDHKCPGKSGAAVGVPAAAAPACMLGIGLQLLAEEGCGNNTAVMQCYG